MLRGGALVNALVLFLVIAGISGSLVFYAYIKRVEYFQFDEKERVINNARSGINYIIGLPEKIPLGQIVKVDLFKQDKDWVELNRKLWGAFEIATSKGVGKNTSFIKSALLGANIYNDRGVSLYLADQNKPLSLCGKTELTGTCYLPKAGVKRAYIEGQSFTGNKLVDGEIKESDRNLPLINQEFYGNKSYLQYHFSPTDSLTDEEQFLEKDTIIHSFSLKSQVIYSKEKLELTDKVIEGNIIIVSEKRIVIGANTSINGVLFYAPEILIEDGFNGNLQAFASDSIHVGKSVVLYYPSVIGLIKNQTTSEMSEIIIDDNTRITGVVFAYTEQENGKSGVYLSVNKKVIINGQVYCNGAVDLKGSIFGNLTCQKFLLKTPSSVYENHLLNAVVDYSKLSPHFIGINLTGNTETRNIVRWLE